MVGALVLGACTIRSSETPCTWVSDSSASLHEEIKRAEDISIRHTDAKNLGVGAVRRETRHRCEAELFAAIANSRSISVDAVLAARRELDQRGFDWLVNLPMAGFTIAAVLTALRRVRNRFPDDQLARVVAIVLLSVGLGVLVIGVGQVWAFAVEAVRIGNDHLGHRGLRIPWRKHRATTFALVVLTTWAAAAMPVLRGHLRHPRHPGTNP